MGVAVDLASGTAAGAAQLLVGHPFDTVKVNMQLGGADVTAMGTVRRIVASHGFLGMYRGLAAPLTTMAAFNALLFSSRGMAERLLSPDGSPLTLGQLTLAGGIAGVPVSLLAAPTELIKCRLQAQGGARPPPGVVYSLADIRAGRALFHGPRDVLRHLVQHEGGILAAYRGLGATLLRETPGNAAYFGVYEGGKLGLARWQDIDVSQLGTGSLMAAGGVGGAAFWILTYPIDVAKSRLQTQNIHSPDRYRGTFDCLSRLFKTEGWRSWWRGFGPCIIRSIPANAVAFLVFERVRTILTQ